MDTGQIENVPCNLTLRAASLLEREMGSRRFETSIALTRRDSITLLLLLIIATLVKLDYLSDYERLEPLADAPYGDSVVYLDEVARLFGTEHHDGAGPAFYKPPLYVILLHSLGATNAEGWATLRRVQMLMGLGILALAYVIAARLGGTLAGVVAFLLLLFYAPLSFQETKLLDTTLGILTTLIALAAIQSPVSRGTTHLTWLSCGVMFGVAALARPAQLIVAASLAPLILRYGTTKLIALLVGIGLALLPITLFNIRSSGDLILVNYSEGYTFLVGNNPNARGIYNLPAGYPDGVLSERLVEWQQAAQVLGRAPSPSEQRDNSIGQGLQFLSENPAAIPRLLWDKLRFAIATDEIPDNYSLRREVERFGLLSWHVVPYGLLLALGIGGLALVAQRRELGVVLLPLAASLLLLLIAYVSSRYRLPTAPLLAILAGVAVSSARTAPRARRLMACLLVTGVLVLSVWIPLPQPRADLERSGQMFDAILELHAEQSRALSR